MKTFTAFTIGVFISLTSYCQLLTESFNDVTTLQGAGWALINTSTNPSITGWFQGKPSAFHAYAGTPKQYIVSEFDNSSGTNTISNWLITPVISVDNGYTLMFYTRNSPSNALPDRLQVRLSDAGSSSINPTNDTDVGSYTNLLLEINSTQSPGSYPAGWTQQTVNISGLLGLTDVRIAFRYYVSDVGPNGGNLNYMGIDEVSVAATLSADNPSMKYLKCIFNKASYRLILESKSNLQNLSLYNLEGEKVLSSKLEGTHNEVDLSAMKTGVYIANVTSNNLNTFMKLIIY